MKPNLKKKCQRPMKPDAGLAGDGRFGAGTAMRVCSNRKSHETKSARLVGHSMAWRTCLQQGTGGYMRIISHCDKSERERGRELY